MEAHVEQIQQLQVDRFSTRRVLYHAGGECGEELYAMGVHVICNVMQCNSLFRVNLNLQ